MKIPKEHKEVILKKVNVLIKEFLIDRYLKYGEHENYLELPCGHCGKKDIWKEDHDECIGSNNEYFEHLTLLIHKLLSVQFKIESDEDIDVQFLMWVDGEYKQLYNEKMEKQI